MANPTVRVVFSKAHNNDDYVEIARGTWELGCEPRLTGEPIPPVALRGMEVQMCGSDAPRGSVVYDHSGVRYLVEFVRSSDAEPLG